MKRIIAFVLAAILLLFTFTACGKKVVTDEEGNTHVLVTRRGGEPAQDENGNLIEKVTNEDGEKVTQAVTFPRVTQNNKNEVENAYFKVKIPDDWTYDENINTFRIQHNGECKNSDGGVCEISAESAGHGDVDVLYNNRLGTENVLKEYQPDFVGEIKQYETKLFDLDVKAFSSKHTSGSTYYFFAFSYANAAVGITANVNDKCLANGFDIEKFITENFTLKKLG